MTQLNDKEQYFCQSCLAVVSLNTTGRCETCNADNVVPMAAIQAIADALKPHMAEPKSRPTTPRLSIDQLLHTRIWYYLRCSYFETVVSYTKASNLQEAIQYAMSPVAEWYVVREEHEKLIVENTLETRLLNHAEFNLWCNKNLQLNLDESTSYNSAPLDSATTS